MLSDLRSHASLEHAPSKLIAAAGLNVLREVAAPPAAAQVRGRTFEPSESIDGMSLSKLRHAIRSNRVSFPSQVPTFRKHDRPDLQRKMVQLYFLFGWNCGAIATRYGMIRQRVQQILNTWKRRAIQTGYIQQIPSEADVARAAVGAHHLTDICA